MSGNIETARAMPNASMTLPTTVVFLCMVNLRWEDDTYAGLAYRVKH
jgi:hypothetical protein